MQAETEASQIVAAVESSGSADSITLVKLDNILATTLKHDETTKRILFLTGILTYTDSDQQNVGLLGSSSTGKTYNSSEIFWYFPKEDIIELQGASKTSFIHKNSAVIVDKRNMKPIDYCQKPKKGDSREKRDEWSELMRNKIFYLNYRQKIILLPDMPDSKLFSSIRPMLSHDREYSQYSVTEPNTMKTKEIMIRGFATCVFSTAKTYLDEQEVTRFFLLSPESTKEKIKADIELISRKNSDINFEFWHEHSPERLELKEQVRKVKEAKINRVLVPENLIGETEKWYVESHELRPKSHRDYPRILSLAKAWALLNFENRRQTEIEGKKVLYVNEEDLKIAKEIYGEILESNEKGVSPECWKFYKSVVLPEIENSVIGAPIENFHKRYFEVNKQLINGYRLKGMLENLEGAGLICKDTSVRPFRYSKSETVNIETKNEAEKW